MKTIISDKEYTKDNAASELAERLLRFHEIRDRPAWPTTPPGQAGRSGFLHHPPMRQS